MKYIRTKDGVYEIERYYKQGDYYWVKQDCEQPIDSDEIIAQADTIEELCDEFVIFEEYSKKPFLFNGSVELLKHYIEKMSGLVKHILGAIWTDKGLTYVAKMNEEGELELL